MFQLLNANLRAHWQRYFATAVAIILSTTFIMVCLSAAAGLSSTLQRTIVTSATGADALVVPQKDYVPADQEATEFGKIYQKLSAEPKLIVHAEAHYLIQIKHNGHNAYTGLTPMPPKNFSVSPLKEGKYPTNSHEITLEEPLVKSLGFKIGEDVHYINQFTDEKGTVKLVGITKPPAAFVTKSVAYWGQKIQPGPLDAQTIMVAGTNAVAKAKDAVGASTILKVQNHDEYVKAQLKGTEVATITLNGAALFFPAISAVTAIVVITTTFNVLFTSRRRELALLRAIGADRGQIRRLVVFESISVGAISAALGVGLGYILGAVISYIAGFTDTWGHAFTDTSILAVIGTFLGGVFITLIAGHGPTRRAIKVSPMVALAPETVTATTKKRTIRNTIAIVVLVLTSLIIFWELRADTMAMNESQIFTRLLLIMLFSLIAFVAILVICASILPYLTAGLAKLLSKNPVIALAGGNTLRNQGRTGNTGAALILGTTLVVTLMVGTASVERSYVNYINQKNPTDLVLTSEHQISLSTTAKLKKIKGIAAQTYTSGGRADMSIKDGKDHLVQRMPHLEGITHSLVKSVEPGQIGVPEQAFEDAPKEITVTTASGSKKLKKVSTPLQHYTLSTQDFDQLVGDPTENKFAYLRLKDVDSLDFGDVITSISEADQSLSISGSAPERLTYMKILKGLMWSILAMLAVSILVALVGVANTLSLSVVERARENALLRALGLTRSGMRKMLAVESILLAVVSVTIGIGLGVVFATIGMHAIPFADARFTFTQIVLPPWQIGGVIAVAVLASLIASVAPGRRAAKSSPVEVLSHVE